MRILTLFLALFLTLLPESIPFNGYAHGQDACWEEVDGIEEEENENSIQVFRSGCNPGRLHFHNFMQREDHHSR